MSEEATPDLWTYNRDDDQWVSADGTVIMPGPFIRQMARNVLRTRRTRALSALASSFSPEATEYRQGLVDMLAGDLPFALAS